MTTPENAQPADLDAAFAQGELDRTAHSGAIVTPTLSQGQAEPTDEYIYAKSLADSLWRKHYRDAAPDWRPLPDLLGVLSQIDNMASHLAASSAAPTEDLRAADWREWFDGQNTGHYDRWPLEAMASSAWKAALRSTGDWQQYAKEGENAEACIARHRREMDGVLNLLAEAKSSAAAPVSAAVAAPTADLRATTEPTYTGSLRDPGTWATSIAGIIDSYLSSENAVRERDAREAALAGIISRRIGWLTAPEHVPDPGCKSCSGTGSVCVGHSGREDDGDAPIMEQCDCYWPVSAEGVKSALEEVARLEGEIRTMLDVHAAAQLAAVAAPEARIPLTDAQIDAVVEVMFRKDNHWHDAWLEDIARPIAREIEAALRHPAAPGSSMPSAAPLSEPCALDQGARPVWQPIETAPKDGRGLLLGHFNANGKWRSLRGGWCSADAIAEWEDPDCEEGWYEQAVEADDVPNCWWTNPTHWMPLPPAPGSAPPVAQQEGSTQ